MSKHEPSKLYHQLPSEIIMEILSFLTFKVKIFGKQIKIFKYYFGRFPTSGHICFLFHNLDWTDTILYKTVERQAINIELCANQGRRIDLLDHPKSDILMPNLKKHTTEEEVIENLERIFKNVDKNLVKSVKLSDSKMPVYVAKWALQNFTALEIIEFDCDYYSSDYYGLSSLAPLISNCKHLKKLELNCIEGRSTESMILISRGTPLMECFKNLSLTSIFTAPEIFENWKNLKQLESTVYLIRGEITADPTTEEVSESFKLIQKLNYLETLELIGEEIQDYGVPFCVSVKKMTLGLSYANFSDILMDTISKNSQLKELSFKNGGNREILVQLKPETFKDLEVLEMYSISNELVDHFSKFESIKKLSIQYAQIDENALNYFDNYPKLEKVFYSKGASNSGITLPKNGRIVFEEYRY